MKFPRYLLGIAALSAYVIAYADGVPPIVPTSQVPYGSPTKTLTSTQDVTISTSSHQLCALKGVRTSTITFADGTILASTSTLGGSGAAIWGAITGSITSQADLQVALSSIGTSTASLRTSVNAVAVATGTLQTQVNNIAVATGTLLSNINSVAVSTGQLNATINIQGSSIAALGASTGTIQSQVNNVAVATGTLQTQITNVAVATGTLVTLSTNQNISGVKTFTSSITVKDVSASTITADGSITANGNSISSATIYAKSGNIAFLYGYGLVVSPEITTWPNHWLVHEFFNSIDDQVDYYTPGATLGSPIMTMRSGSGGRVGIGTTNPQQLLDVNGNVNVGNTLSAVVANVSGNVAGNSYTNATGIIVNKGVTYNYPSSGTIGGYLQYTSTNTVQWVPVVATGGGSSALGVTTGTSAGFAVVTATPTGTINFENSQFNVALKGGSTAYITVNQSSVTLLGNTVNSANHIVVLSGTNQLPVSDGNLLTNLSFAAITGTTGNQVPFASGGGLTQSPIFTFGSGELNVSTVSVTQLMAVNITSTTMGNATSTSFGANPYVTIQASGTAEGLLVDLFGTPSGGVQNMMGGVTIRCLTAGGPVCTPMVVVDSTTDSQVGTGLLEIWERNKNHNDPGIWYHDQSDGSGGQIRIDATGHNGPNFEITGSSDLAIGLSKWEPFAEAGQGGIDLQINNRSNDNSGFETIGHWHPLSKSDQLPGLYIHSQNSTADVGVVPSSGTAGISFFTLNNHTVSLTAAPNVSTSWINAMPDLIGSQGQVMYHGGTVADGPFTIRQWKWSTGGQSGFPLTYTGSAPSWSNVLSSVSIQGSSAGAYTATFSSSAVGFQVAFSTNGHVISNGGAPSISACGSTPNGSVVGDDNAGTITIGGGVVTACTLTFNKPWGTTPSCVLTDNSTTIPGDISSISATALTASFSASVGGGTVWYRCTCSGSACQ